MLARIHSLGQALFLRADAVFNRLFGERHNPLYSLGSISYTMFWIVVVSGLYVYAFYETGVDTTYASVVRLTTRQPWLGGLMRSLHRYASDAMVLTMLLHLARHFFFDHYRSFRAFSWVTGVILLWLVFVSGVNGYMLPWDRLAQYVTIAAAEWLDALPAFRGVLARNFVFQEAITDRFFSLLQFLHIGIPLAVLIALWIHTQRVPRARVVPSRPVAIGVVVSLLVLAIVKPAVGQGPVDFGSMPVALAFDWFYLAVLPLADRYGGMNAWTAVGVLTLVGLLLPWLPPKRAAKGGTFHLTFHPGNRTVPVRSGETLLDAGLRATIPLPYECRSGGCGLCKASVLNGEVDPGIYQKNALPDAERAAGKVLLCCASPLSDLEVEYEEGAAVREQPLPVHVAQVERLEKLAHDVMLVALRLPQGNPVSFTAGQYLNILLPDGDRRSYSFTTPGGSTELVLLHIRRIPGGKFTGIVFDRLKVGDRLRFEGPLGSFILHEPSERPLIFVCGATGFAPVKSLLEEAFRMGITRPLYLYWGVRQRRDLYLAGLPEAWEREHPNFRFVPVLSDPGPDDAWTGRTGFVHEAILADFPDMAGFSVYACGSVGMIDTARPAFVAQGLGEEYCFSDAFVPGRSARPDAAAPQ